VTLSLSKLCVLLCRREFPSDIKKREEEEKRKKDEQVQYIKNFDNKCNIGDMTAWISTLHFVLLKLILM
jgi:hypothetical protein